MINNFKTFILLAGLTALLLVIGQLLGGKSGIIIALVFALGINFFSWWFSDKIVLKMYRARPLEANEYPRIKAMVEELSVHANIPAPGIYVIPHTTPNAFATGRNPANSVVALTSGIIEGLNPNQLKGVIAHEISHIKHSDTLISTVAATVAGAIGFLATMARWAMIFGGGSRDDDNNNILGLIIVSILAPIAAMIIQMAISRQREYAADREAATLCGNPDFLIEALRNLEANNRRQPISRGNPATAHLFIVNPFKLKGLTRLFSTHPPIEERINKLQSYGV